MRHFIYACLVIIICRLIGSWVFSTFDDAFTSFRYAQQLVDGHGLIYNLHERVLGTTAPLFAIIAAIPLLLSVSVPKFFIGFNILCDLGSLWLVYRYIFHRDNVLLILFIVLFSLDPVLNRIAVGGMEANLFLFSSLLGLVLYFNGNKYAAFLIQALIYFLRPEAILLFLILFLYEWYERRLFPWRYLFCCLLIMGPVLFSIYFYYGQLLPQSVVAKNTGHQSSFHELVRDIFFPHFFNYLLFPLALFGMIKMMRRNGYYMIITTWFVLYGLAYCIRGPWILNWYIYAMEFTQIIFATLAILEISKSLHIDRMNYKLFLLLPLLSVLVWIVTGFRMGRSAVETNVYDEMKRDFSHDTGIKSKIFFADDIGALGFYSRAYIYDNLMLVSPQAARYKNARERILHLNPDFLFIYADPGYLRLVMNDSLLSARYHFIKRYSRDGEKSLPARPAEAYPGYRQDYILWGRN
jgi:hypothetical membrane protein